MVHLDLRPARIERQKAGIEVDPPVLGALGAAKSKDGELFTRGQESLRASIDVIVVYEPEAAALQLL